MRCRPGTVANSEPDTAPDQRRITSQRFVLRRVRGTIAGIDCLLRACAFRAVQSKPFNIGQALQEAVSLHQQGRLREAEKLYTRMLKAAPDNFDALHLLGLIKAQNAQMGEAYRLMLAALKINPNAPDALVNISHTKVS